MNVFKKILLIIITYVLLFNSIKINTYADLDFTSKSPIKVAVFLNDFKDQFISNVRKDLEDIEKENPTKVQFTFFDAKANQAIQNESIDKALSDGFNLFVLNPVNTKIDEIRTSINKIAQQNNPLILYYAETPSIVNLIKPYDNAVIIDTDINESGVLQGKIIADAWNNNKETFDRNKDNIMQYIMLNGPLNSPETAARTKYSLQAINESGIKTQELSSTTCNWDEECAKTAIEANLLALNGKIEAIIANNDAMAIGAIKALKNYGYNTDDKSKYIPVVGIDGLPEAKELIRQGTMTGTVIQDPRVHANTIYTIGSNLVKDLNPLSDTNYKFDETGKAIKLPYYEYTN